MLGDALTLCFEAVQPNRTDIFGKNHPEAVIRYKRFMYKFLGLTTSIGGDGGGGGAGAGVYVPHGDEGATAMSAAGVVADVGGRVERPAVLAAEGGHRRLHPRDVRRHRTP